MHRWSWDRAIGVGRDSSSVWDWNSCRLHIEIQKRIQRDFAVEMKCSSPLTLTEILWDVRRLNQTRESTGDRPAFSRFRSSSSYNNCNPNRFRIEFKLQFLKANRIPDHQSYIIDRVNLNIGRVGYCKYFISSESDGAILLIRSHMILCNGHKSYGDQYSCYIVTYKPSFLIWICNGCRWQCNVNIDRHTIHD